MTTVRAAIEALGIELLPDETLAIVTIPAGGKPVTRRFQDVADAELEPNTYYSTGTFPADTTFQDEHDRAGENVQRVIELPFDFDLYQYLGCSRDVILELDQDELMPLIDNLQREVERMMAEVGLPISRLDYTGNGVAVFTRVPSHGPKVAAEVRALHKAIVKRINTIWGGEFADRKVSDAGSRIMRIPFGINRKVSSAGVIAEREIGTLYQTEAIADEVALRIAAGPLEMIRTARAVPKSGKAMDPADLSLIVNAIAEHWQEGQRHALALGLAAMLAKAGVPESQAEEIVGEVAAADPELKDRITAVHTTYDRYRRGAEIEGYFALREFLPAETLVFVDQQLDRIRKATWDSSTLTFGGKPVRDGEDLDDKHRPIQFDEYPEPPAAAFYGWFKRYVDLMHPTTEASRGFHLACALTVAGSVVGRRIAVRYASDKVYPNQYTLLVGPTGSSRKGTAMKRAYRLPQYRGRSLRHVHPDPFKIVTNIGSGASVVKTLREFPNTLLALEEATTLFANMHRKGGDELIDRMIEAWDSPALLQDNVKNNPNTAQNPFLAMMAGIQPGRLEEALGANEIESGLANRIGIFFGVRREIVARAPDVDEVAAAALYTDLYHAVLSYPEGTALQMSDAAGDLWDRWYLDYSKRKGTEDELAMRIRHPDMVQKWALLFAITDRSDAIEPQHLTAAIAILDWMWEGIKRRLPTWGVSIDRKIEELIFQTLKRHGRPMKKRDLQLKCSRRQWSGRDFAAVFRAMEENGHLVIDHRKMVALAEDIERAEEDARAS